VTIGAILINGAFFAAIRINSEIATVAAQSFPQLPRDLAIVVDDPSLDALAHQI
jgi:hypothetical protein